MNLDWWDIPIIFVGYVIGSWLANIFSLWFKRKLGWIE